MDWMLVIGVMAALVAILAKVTKRDTAAITMLVLAAFFLRLYAAHLDRFLHDWDEKFHALVARNLMDDPFYPALKKGIDIPFDFKSWCCNEVWLHKQPLFLWQMALSMKIFGVSEVTMRYPSVLLGAIIVFFLYRIARILSKDEHLPFGAALLMCFSQYHLELTSGFHGMDHNDVAYGFYVLASIWAFGEYSKSEKKLVWFVLIGVFAGCAVLNKWLTGILVYAGWGLTILLSLRRPGVGKEILHLLLSFTVCVIIFLPWQLYIHSRFPVEAAYEMEHTRRHLFEVVEGHKGTTSFYWDYFPTYFGETVWILVPVGLVAVLFVSAYDRRMKIMLITSILVIYTFFSFIAQTKLITYFFVMAPVAFILMAVPLSRLAVLLKLPRHFVLLLYAVVAFFVFNYNGIKANHDPKNGTRIAREHNTEIYKQLKKHLPPGYHIVGNLAAHSDVECMFFNKGIKAYHYNFSPAELEVVRSRKLKVAVFKDHYGYGVPAHVLSYPDVHLIDMDLWPQ